MSVAFRESESLFTRSAGPKLLKYVPFFHPTADVHNPLTPALSPQIAARAAPYVEGTGALYLCESSDSTKVSVRTTRHVVLPPNAGSNELYIRENVSRPRRDVLHLGSKAFQNVLKAILVRIGLYAIMVNHYHDRLEELATRVSG